MSQRTVYGCDLCGADCHKDAIRGFPDLKGRTVDVGPCCYRKPITDLINKFIERDEADKRLDRTTRTDLGRQ